VFLSDGEPRTTSLAIAEGTNNDHASVILLVRKYVEDLREFGLVDFKSTSTGGRPTEYASLNQEQSTLLMTYMRNSEIVRGFKKRLVKAFFEMARAKTPLVELTRVELLRMALESEEQKLALSLRCNELTGEVEILSPKAAALDRIATADGSLCITNASKDLQIRPKDLFAFLSGHKWIYRRAGGGGFVAYQDKLQSGLLEHKVTIVSRSDGSEKLTEQVLVTAKGMTRLAEALAVTA
jgi:phage antirepressor YoqD-like protein